MSDAVAKRSAASQAMVDAATKGRALMAGTTGMREAGEAYLPKFAAESREAYKERLSLSWLFNGYRKTVRDMTGRVFSAPVELDEGAPANVQEWAMNIDMAGRDLSTFARQVFEDTLDAGISYIWVDSPPRPEGATRAQVQAANLRPYLVHLAVEEVLGWKAETVNNVTVLTQLRIMESVNEIDPDDEFAEVHIPQVRVLDRTDAGVMTRLYRKVKGANGKEEWRLHDEPTFSQMPEITVVPFYANRTGFFAGMPLLDDLADVNIAHWQSQSDQRNILHFARTPILFAAGRSDEDGPLVISPGMATTSSDPSAKLEWVEHTGAAIDAGRQDLKDLEFQMETHGLQLLVSKAQKTATGEALDAAKETSQLAMTADQLQDTLERALAWMAEYAGTPADISVKVNKEYGVGMMTAQELTVLLQAVNTGNMSRETFLRELARRGMVAPDLDPNEEGERIDATAPRITGEPLGLE
jgi:hypothetical protein